MRTNRHRRLLVRNATIAAAIAALGILLGVPARAYEFQNMNANAYGQVELVMPSGNIGCIYTPAGGTPFYSTMDGQAEIQCDRVEPAYIRGVLGASGPGVIVKDVGDPSCCGGSQKFQYDRVVQLGPFQCLSTRKGLTCARQDGSGFFLSRAVVEAR